MNARREVNISVSCIPLLPSVAIAATWRRSCKNEIMSGNVPLKLNDYSILAFRQNEDNWSGGLVSLLCHVVVIYSNIAIHNCCFFCPRQQSGELLTL